MPADLADRLRAVALDRLYPGSPGP
jgi:hypothetical protein